MSYNFCKWISEFERELNSIRVTKWKLHSNRNSNSIKNSMSSNTRSIGKFKWTVVY